MTVDVALIFNNVELHENVNAHFLQALLFSRQHKSVKKLKATFKKTFTSESWDQGKKNNNQ